MLRLCCILRDHILNCNIWVLTIPVISRLMLSFTSSMDSITNIILRKSSEWEWDEGYSPFSSEFKGGLKSYLKELGCKSWGGCELRSKTISNGRSAGDLAAELTHEIKEIDILYKRRSRSAIESKEYILLWTIGSRLLITVSRCILLEYKP